MSSKVGGLVTRGWLRKAIQEPLKHLRVLEAARGTEGKLPYLQNHIPTAQYLDLQTGTKPIPTLPFNLPEIEVFSEHLRDLGVNKDDHVVVYDRGSFFPACRAWWLLRAYGMDNVSVLDGGLPHYVLNAEARLEEGDKSPPMAGDFEANPKKSFIKDFNDVKDVIGSRSAQIVDTRRHKHFMGEEKEPTASTKSALQATGQPLPSRMIQGHIPGSLNIPHELLTDPHTGLMHTKDELLELFAGHGIKLNRPIIATSYTGYTNCIAALALHICGKEDCGLYYGSWTEWGQRACETLQIRSPQKKRGFSA